MGFMQIRCEDIGLDLSVSCCWWALVNTEMNIGVSKGPRYFLVGGMTINSSITHFHWFSETIPWDEDMPGLSSLSRMPWRHVLHCRCSPTIVISALDPGKCTASRLYRFYSLENSPRHRMHSNLCGFQSPTGTYWNTMTNAVVWDVTPFRSC
jgi:hypothetical protein